VTFVASDLRLDGGNELGWDRSQWRSQVDGVMGGKSSGFLQFEDSDTTMSFSGDISLDGGGFSNLRKDFNPIDLSQYAGIVVGLETTDGYNPNDIQSPLALHLQLQNGQSRYGYASAFAIPVANTSSLETSVYLPLDSFDKSNRRGYQCSSCVLDTSSVNGMRFSVLFQKGPFDVRVKSITAVDDAKSFPSPVISLSSSNEIKELVESTIESGGSVYDYGYKELCIAMYRSTLNTVLAASGDDISDTLKGMACEGLDRAGTQSSKRDIAWTLRYTMDAILEELGFLDPDYGQGWRPNVANATALANQCSAVTSYPPVVN